MLIFVAILYTYIIIILIFTGVLFSPMGFPIRDKIFYLSYVARLFLHFCTFLHYFNALSTVLPSFLFFLPWLIVWDKLKIFIVELLCCSDCYTTEFNHSFRICNAYFVFLNKTCQPWPKGSCRTRNVGWYKTTSISDIDFKKIVSFPF